MAKNVHKIADLLGATVVSQVPETGGGAFGAARLAHLAAALQFSPRAGPGPPPRPPDRCKLGPSS